MSLRPMHGRHADLSIADQPVKIYMCTCRWRRRSVSSSLGPAFRRHELKLHPPPAAWVHWFSAYPPPLRWALLQIWLRPYHWAPTSVGASFFARSPAAANLHGSPSHCVIVSPLESLDSPPINSTAFVAPFLQGQTLRLMISGPCPPLGRGLFLALWSLLPVSPAKFTAPARTRHVAALIQLRFLRHMACRVLCTSFAGGQHGCRQRRLPQYQLHHRL